MLAQENHPFFFHELAAAAARHGLEYLGEADIFDMSDVLLPAAIRERLAGVRGVIDKEQYLDILRNRVFRQTLLCHAGRAISRALDGETLRALFFSAAGEAAPGEREDEVVVRQSFGTMSTTNPLVKAVVTLLAEVAPARLGFAELASEVQRRHPDLAGAIQATLPVTLAHATMSGIVKIHASPASFTTDIAAQPVASALARVQAARGEALFTLDHSRVSQPDKAVRAILPLLDGTRDQVELARALDCDTAEVAQTLRVVARHALLVK
jgi:methyltransferase-like protein